LSARFVPRCSDLHGLLADSLRPLRCCIAALFLLSIRSTTLLGVDLSARVVDGLGRPVGNATVEIYWLQSFSETDVRKIDLAKLKSDRNGNIKKTFDESALANGRQIWVYVSKNGYSGYYSTGLQPEFVLERKFAPADIRRIAALNGPIQLRELRELLGGDFEDSGGEPEDLMFVREHRLRSALRGLICDPKVGTRADGTLAFIGVPEDVRLVVANEPSPKGGSLDNRWAYGVVSALLEPSTEQEWTFLKACATNRYDDPWVDAGAIRTLKLIASPRSKLVLEEVARANANRAEDVNEGLRYIDSAPAPLVDVDLIAAGKKLAQAIGIGKWRGNKPPRFNAQKDKALIKCEFIAGSDLLVHTATFEKVRGIWKLRGVRETMQALLNREPDTEDAEKPKK
jgi:hypothetical protein